MAYPKCPHCLRTWTADWEYCPNCSRNYAGALYPELFSKLELDSADTATDLIRDSFRSVELGDGRTIHVADLEGHCYDGRGDAARAKDPETNWIDIPDWKLERIHVLSHAFDIQGWRFHLPAYLVWTLNNWRTSDSATSDFVIWGLELRNDSDYQLRRFRFLTFEQSRSVLAFLEHFEIYSGESDASAAISSYWGRFKIPPAKE